MPFRPRPWMLASVVWIVPAIFATLDAAVQWRLHGWEPLTLQQLLFSGGDWLIYGALTPVIFWAARRWPVARPHFTRRAWLHMGFAILFCFCWAIGGKLLQAALGFFFAPEEFAKAAANPRQLGIDTVSWIFTTLPFGVIVYLCITGIAHALQFFLESRDREVQLARMSEQLAGARFASLQAQVNPHFLFNTLNTIVVKARDGDNAGTVRMVEQLSEMLRRTLTRHRSNEVPLEDELDLVRQYVGIEQARFSDRLTVTFDVAPSTLRAAVPSFAVQHLVENAIRHGIAKRTEAGEVRITADLLEDAVQVTVQDNGPGIGPAAAAAGRGLDTTRERLSSLYGGRGSLVVEALAAGGTRATLRVPFREILRDDENRDG
jgi:two-component system LytT family sensor kinase